MNSSQLEISRSEVEFLTPDADDALVVLLELRDERREIRVARADHERRDVPLRRRRGPSRPRPCGCPPSSCPCSCAAGCRSARSPPRGTRACTPSSASSRRTPSCRRCGPFSISRCSTRWMSNFLYCASRTPRAMFSKSMKSERRWSTAGARRAETHGDESLRGGRRGAPGAAAGAARAAARAPEPPRERGGARFCAAARRRGAAAASFRLPVFGGRETESCRRSWSFLPVRNRTRRSSGGTTPGPERPRRPSASDDLDVSHVDAPSFLDDPGPRPDVSLRARRRKWIVRSAVANPIFPSKLVDSAKATAVSASVARIPPWTVPDPLRDLLAVRQPQHAESSASSSRVGESQPRAGESARRLRRRSGGRERARPGPAWRGCQAHERSIVQRADRVRSGPTVARYSGRSGGGSAS